MNDLTDKDYVLEALKARLRVIWSPLLLRRLRREVEQEPDLKSSTLWRPFLETELPPYRLTPDERAEERELVEEISYRIDAFPPSAELPGRSGELAYRRTIRRVRRLLQNELGFVEAKDIYDIVFRLLPLDEKQRFHERLRRLRSGIRQVIPGGKIDPTGSTPGTRP